MYVRIEHWISAICCWIPVDIGFAHRRIEYCILSIWNDQTENDVETLIGSEWMLKKT